MTLPEKIRVVMADDHEIFRDGFRLTLSRTEHIELVAAACNGRELLALVKQHTPQVVITDIKMPLMDGIEACRKIMEAWPQTGVIGLSMFDEEDLILEMLDAGAKGYLVKNADKTEVIEAIETVNDDKPFYCRQTSSRLTHLIAKKKHHPNQRKKFPDFTDKELEIIQLVCQEYTTKEISDKLFLSTRTIDGHRINILEKMGAKNTVGLVIYAIQNELFVPEHS